MLKHRIKPIHQIPVSQPPLGGCVLKQAGNEIGGQIAPPAAFRRLCVETIFHKSFRKNDAPAAFRRLCVETFVSRPFKEMSCTSRL